MAAKLFPLNIPSGWAVIRNGFTDEDPIVQNGWIVNSHAYSEDLLLLHSLFLDAATWVVNPQGYWIHLGWYPHGNPQGCYQLTLGQGEDKTPQVRYESQQRESIGKVIETCFNLIHQGNSGQLIQQHLETNTLALEHNPRIFSGTRKVLIKYPVEKKNRLTYSQVSLWSPCYYEVTNLVYMPQKSNQATYNGFVSENFVSERC